MAKGIRRGDGGRNLITFHPRGGEGSAQYFHDEDWLDFNMRQNGHIAEYSGNYGNRLNDKLKDYGQTRIDFNRNPTKPVIDGEPLYEDHPLSFNAKELGHSIASDVRRHLYWNLFNGAFGHTYGHHSIWQMWSKGKNPINSPLMPWQEALNQPGSAQMQYGRKLIESRPFLTRIPDNSIIVTDRVPTSVPGVGRYKFVATRDTEGTYGMVYVPVGRPFRVNMKTIAGEKVRAWWFNPRNGEATEIGIFDNEGTHTFIPPDKGEALDWVLVLDDTTQNYAPPGTSKAASMRKPPDDPPGGALAGEKSRLIVLSDIGTKVDPDDFQSMVHLLLYSNILDIEGLIGSMTWRGDNMEAIEEVIAAYEKDYDRLISHSPDFPTPEYLRSVTKKGATRASNGGYRTEGTQGSDWIIERAHEDDPRPLWISVWGAITDVAQAVYEDPSIKEKIRVFSIGAWNTTQDQDARDYLYNHHSDLYWIESNDSFRGMWAGGDQSGDFSGEAFVKKHIKGHGALGDYYWDHRSAPPVTKNPKWNYYLREGDTPSWLYLVRGDINDPEKEHWGGQYKKTGHGPNYYSDHPNSEYQELIDGKNYKGVKTVNRWRKAYLLELMKRMDWAKKSK